MYSAYLRSRHALCKELLSRLLKRYDYVSILGKQVTGKSISVSAYSTSLGDTGERQCGFVVQILSRTHCSEYSFSDITEDTIDQIEKNVIEKTELAEGFEKETVSLGKMKDEPLVKDFYRPVEDGVNDAYPSDKAVKRLGAIKDRLMAYSDKIVQAVAVLTYYDTSSMFLSRNRDLSQDYTWINVMAYAAAREGSNIKNSYSVGAYNSFEKSFRFIEERTDQIAQLAIDLLHSEHIVPGVYDIVTDPSITGLIAHEAFGHGVEMDMFVKNRAKSVNYIGKPVASKLVEMHDGAQATLSAASYFFDDDGVLGQDTTIIKNGILERGISDAVSALQLGTEPTGNSRRESYKRKAYTRMTNTFFSEGKDKLEDMIASVKHGYYLVQTDNGMEDPKNWNIQCVCAYGREIQDGKFTGKIVSPVVMSGYVPDLLGSISAVSDSKTVIGSGHCGKGYKEWVTVSDGGPCLKARCKLG